MHFFNRVKRAMTQTAKITVEKSQELYEVTKINLTISNEREKISKIYKEMAKNVYDLYKQGEISSKILKDKCDEIDLCEMKINKLKEQILDMKNIKPCQNCETNLENSSIYCYKCGIKQIK